MFPPRYHGTIFNVFLTGDSNSKTAQYAHVITSLDACELFSADWKTSIVKFQPADVERVEAKQMLAVVTLKPGSRFASLQLNTSPDPAEPLDAALTKILSIPKPEIRFLALGQLLPTFKFANKRDQIDLHKAVMDHSTQLLQIFTYSKTPVVVSGPFVDVFSALFRLRYANDAVTPVEANVRELSIHLRRHVVSLWSRALLTCLAPTEDLSARIFAGQLVEHIGSLIQKVAKPLSLSCDQLIEYIGAFVNEGIADGIAETAQELAEEAELLMKQELDKVPPYHTQNFHWMRDVTVIALAGITTQLHQADVDLLAGKVVDFALKLVEQKPMNGPTAELLAAQATFMDNLLALLDGQRYEEMFQFVYCLWHLRNGPDD
jgi:hypothetical protein